MSKPNLLVVCPPDHYALRNLAQIGDLANVSISNNEAEIERLAQEAEIILYTGLTGKIVPFSKVWRQRGESEMGPFAVGGRRKSPAFRFPRKSGAAHERARRIQAIARRIRGARDVVLQQTRAAPRRQSAGPQMGRFLHRIYREQNYGHCRLRRDWPRVRAACKTARCQNSCAAPESGSIRKRSAGR